MDMFKIKPVPSLSDTVYSETIDSLKEARKANDVRWLCELHVEAFILLRDQGLLDDSNRVTVGRYEELLWHCHLDAQIPEEID